MPPLNTELRNKLERTVIEARGIAEEGATAALETFAVQNHEPYGHMSLEQRKLRNQLRARARQLGDTQDKAGKLDLTHIAHECAYEHWHRMLFARFLAENNLLMLIESGEPPVPVSLEDCKDLATEEQVNLQEKAKLAGDEAEAKRFKADADRINLWAVAGRYAQKMLPEVFRADDPVLQVPLAREDQRKLEEKLDELPSEIFTASDSLGWCYQFWQTEKKDQVNASGNKIGADELPAVTQLFTEDYMVDFLLDNTLGAWHAGKVLAANPKIAHTAKNEEALRKAFSLPGCPWTYLRFVKDDKDGWHPAAGTFDGWPKTAKELKCLDPCMGSGHFVVAMFERLVALRIAEGGLKTSEAVDAVIRDNLFGLEIDPRCTQIGAFCLALAAWCKVGYRGLPAMHIACSGLAPNTKKEEWLKLAGGKEALRHGMERLYQLFEKAPVLGSLINPRTLSSDLLVAGFDQLQPLLEQALAQESEDAVTHEMAVTARGLATAAGVLADHFSLVATNVPYLGRGKQDEGLSEYCDAYYADARSDLATCMVERCIRFCGTSGCAAVVSPQNWLFLGKDKRLRNRLLKECSWCFVAKLGARGFQTSMFDFNVMLAAFTGRSPSLGQVLLGLDVSTGQRASDKAIGLLTAEAEVFKQSDQLRNPDSRVAFHSDVEGARLIDYANSYQGICTGDFLRFGRCFWEMATIGSDWKLEQTTVRATTDIDGLYYVFLWENGAGQLHAYLNERLGEGGHGAWIRGLEAWGSRGVCISQTGALYATYYVGEAFDNNAAVIIPIDQKHFAAIWAYCSSSDYHRDVRALDQALKVTNITLLKVPFDLAHWQKVATEKYPYGLPKPFSSDPSQWLFAGYPKGADQPLQVAVARLLGYRWPRQTGSSFPDCPALKPDGLEKLEDKDGIVCIPSVRGEQPAADRLLEILTACGIKPDRDLDDWLRNEFFEEHCELFHHRPFIWHVWDGRKSDGFHALVNYHKLAEEKGKGRKVLESLTHSYLNDWITRQKDGVKHGEGGAEERLAAAQELKAKLEAILEGEPPYDIFVRWKPLAKQPIGWDPDINDGVRLNIRPFAMADILRKRVKIKWDKDRGKEPNRPKAEFPWFWGWDEKTTDFKGGKGFDGNRWNDLHYTNDFKRAARKGTP